METTLIIVLVIYFGMAFSMYVHLLLIDTFSSYRNLIPAEEAEYSALCGESYRAAYALLRSKRAARFFCALCTQVFCLATCLAWPYHTWTLVVMPLARRFRR